MRRLTAVGSMLLIIASALAGRDAAPALQEKLAIQIGLFDSGGRTLVETVVALAYQYQLPTGFEYLVQPAARQKLDLKLNNISVKGALTAIAAQLPGYSISFSDGVVEIYSEQARRDPSNLLNTVIEDFQIHDQPPLSASRTLSMSLLYAKFHPPGGYAGSSIYGETNSDRPTVTLHLRNKRIYQILDAIVAKDGESMWSVTVPPEKLSVFGQDLWSVFSLNPPAKDLAFRSALSAMEGIFPYGQ